VFTTLVFISHAAQQRSLLVWWRSHTDRLTQSDRSGKTRRSSLVCRRQCRSSAKHRPRGHRTGPRSSQLCHLRGHHTAIRRRRGFPGMMTEQGSVVKLGSRMGFSRSGAVFERPGFRMSLMFASTVTANRKNPTESQEPEQQTQDLEDRTRSAFSLELIQARDSCQLTSKPPMTLPTTIPAICPPLSPPPAVLPELPSLP
jgi:hypothetical protein